MFYQDDQMLALYKLCFEFCISSPIDNLFLIQLHDCAWWLLELISFLLCDLIIYPTFLCAAVAYIVPIHILRTCSKMESADLTVEETFVTFAMTVRLMAWA